MNGLIAPIQSYLADVLGAPPSPARAWPGWGLPFHLLDSFDLIHLTMFGKLVTLAIDKAPGTLAPSAIAGKVNAIRAKAGLVLYAAPTLSYDDRRSLIERKVPFVIPGNQLYLPDLGIDLREHFRRRAEEAVVPRMSPSTQALLLRHLLDLIRDDAQNPDWPVATTARALGYTGMTASRAASEVTALGLGEIERRQRATHIRFKPDNARAIWEAAKPFARSPVTRSYWLPALPADLKAKARIAGLDALSQQTLLGEPEHATVAVRREDWLGIPDRPVLARPEPGAVEVQVWAYTPSLMDAIEDLGAVSAMGTLGAMGPSDTSDASDAMKDRHVVDPLSLIASLRDDPDERVQAVLKDFEGELPW